MANQSKLTGWRATKNETPNRNTTAARIAALQVPERSAIASPKVRQADLEILSQVSEEFLDTTHFDTVQFPPPDWALNAFVDAAGQGALTYTGYRGHRDVLEAVARTISAFLDLRSIRRAISR